MKYVEVKRVDIDYKLRDAVLERDEYKCRYCGSETPPFHMDHVYPVAKGGETSYENLVTACRSCNSRKSAKTGVFPKPTGYFSENNTEADLRDTENKLQASNVVIYVICLALFVIGSASIMLKETTSGVVMLLLSITISWPFAIGKALRMARWHYNEVFKGDE